MRRQSPYPVTALLALQKTDEAAQMSEPPRGT